MRPDSTEQVFKRWSSQLAQKIQEILPTNPNEADFRHHIEPLLDKFCAEMGLTPLVRSEYTLATGRADAVFNRFVIEYERPGTLADHLDHRQTEHAVQQVKDYILGIAQKERHEVERIAGVAFDGRYIVFVRYVDGSWSVEKPLPVNPHSLERMLTWMGALASGIALTSENLNRDFAIEQLRTQNILRGLFNTLAPALGDSNSLVSRLFEQWRLFFSEAIDYSEAFGGRKLEPLKKWVRKAGIDIKSAEEAERFFFVLHTYFALLSKLLAWVALSRHMGGKMGGAVFAQLTSADSESLRQRLQELESGGIFRAYGILNLLEGDFFSWYLHAWNEEVENALRDILKRLDEYDPTTLTIVPEETRDLFKNLYHYLLPREVRHNLGEYYTPDWLAQRLLVQIDNEFFDSDPARNERRLRQRILQTRFLDPACGSGTFLVLVIARMRELGRALFVKEEELLPKILENIVGFDLNPLAVLTARVNYLLAIADLLEYRRGEISIPVYLADSVRTPAMGEGLFEGDTYQFPTAVGTFAVPAVLAQPGRFDRFCDLLEGSVRSALEPEAFLRRLERELKLAPTEWGERAISLTHELYSRLLDLHRRGLNGIWARLLKNNFAPLTVGGFDYIVGNPPWVNWEHLPDGYRKSIAPLWKSYGIFPHKGFQAILGKSKDDISILMTYVTMDNLLKSGGRLGFVITQSVFKTVGGGKGFRHFRIPKNDSSIPIKVIYVDDMVHLNPFEGASNRTAVIILEKGKPTQYPVPYTVWRKTKGARFTYESTLEEVTQATKRLNFQAKPVDPADPTSSWITARPKALKALRKVLGKSDYEAHAGAYTGGANGVYWVEIVLKRPDGLVVVQNITEGAKVKVEEVTEAIEPDLLYPLLRGRDVKRWRAEPSALILLTHEPGKRLNAIPDKEMQARYPRTYGYLKRFEKALRERAAFKRYFTRQDKGGRTVETGPFYSMFDVGDYTFAPWKVVWTRFAQIEAAVVGTKDGKAAVPQETVTLVECESESKAHYIAALVNSSPFQFAAVSYSQEGGKSMGSMHLLDHIRIPRFDPNNPVHRRLAELSQQAHAAAKAGNKAELARIEAEIDQQAAQLWGLSEAELREIQASLRELGGKATPEEES